MISQDQATIAELGSRLRSCGPLNVRVMTRPTDGEHLLVTSVVNAGQDNAGFEEGTYDYGDVAFAKAVLDGSDVADWLTNRSGEVDGLTFSLPELSSNCRWEHWQSLGYARYGTRFTMPHTEYTVGVAQDRPQSSMSGTPLAGAGLPFFPNEWLAFASVLLDDHSGTFNENIPRELMLVRIAHPEAYIGKVRVSSSAITVSVDGKDLDDVQLQVSSAGSDHEESVSEPGDVSVSISGADSADARVSLVRGRECLDFRTISSRWPDSLEREGIVYEPSDLNERLDRMRRHGESETVEFKQATPDGYKIARAVSAFANGRGGTIIIGIHNDGEVIGISNVPRARDRLDNIIRNSVSPPPTYKLDTCTLGKRKVIALRVEPGDDRPYGARGKGGIRYYVRHNATNWVAEPEEMRKICQPREPRNRSGIYD